MTDKGTLAKGALHFGFIYVHNSKVHSTGQVVLHQDTVMMAGTKVKKRSSKVVKRQRSKPANTIINRSASQSFDWSHNTAIICGGSMHESVSSTDGNELSQDRDNPSPSTRLHTTTSSDVNERRSEPIFTAMQGSALSDWRRKAYDPFGAYAPYPYGAGP